jgi:hypothetical protein
MIVFFMSKTLLQWQEDIALAANTKFPSNAQWTPHDRIESIQNQLDDVFASIRVESGELQSDDHAHQDPDHRIAALIADILILCETRNVDLELELEQVLNWFRNDDKPIN